jgi:hypothetical protein
MGTRHLLTATAIAGSVAFAGAQTTQAASTNVVNLINSYATPGNQATVFEDTTWSFLSPGLLDAVGANDPNVFLGVQVDGFFRIENLGLGIDSPGKFLDESITSSPFPLDDLSQVDLGIHGTLSGKISQVFVAGPTDWRIFVGTSGDTIASIYLQDSFIGNPAAGSNLAALQAHFTQGDLGATLGLGQASDFYMLQFNPGTRRITSFSLALSVVDNFLLPVFETGNLNATVNESNWLNHGLNFANWQSSTADLYASGGNFGNPVTGATFVQGDGDFAAFLVPSPVAAGPALILLGAIGFVRRRRITT